MSRGDIILRLVDITRIYKTKENKEIVALDGVTTSFKRGEFVAIVGKSGSGKSTLINILGGLDRPDSGDYFLEGNNITGINDGNWDALRNEKIGFIFQEYHLIEYLSVYKNVEIALKYQNEMNENTKNTKIKDVLTAVGLEDHMYKLPGQLSGGQRQRVAVARALVKDPDIILADEPTGALDHQTGENIIQLIKGLSKERLVLVVTHNREIANDHATRIIEISEGKFLNDLVREEIEQTYQNVYPKIQPTLLSRKDKIELTSRKIKSQLVRTVFTALSLALAFSFTIIFNGVERGITESYDAYYDALNQSNSYAFSFQPVNDNMNNQASVDTYQNAKESLEEAYQSVFYEYSGELVVGLNKDVSVNGETSAVETVTDDGLYPDLLEDKKVRLIDTDYYENYSFNELFVGNSVYPINDDEIMVTSKFLREYYNISDDVVDLSTLVGVTIDVPEYSFYIAPKLGNVEEYLFDLVEDENNDIVEDESHNMIYDGSGTAIRYLPMNVPTYCYHYDELDRHYQGVCDDAINGDMQISYFESIEEYIAYVDEAKRILDGIEEQYFLEVVDYFELVFHSGNLYYLNDINEDVAGYVHPSGQTYFERVYRQVFSEAAEAQGTARFQYSVYRNQETVREMTITSIVQNENESIMYMDDDTYDSLFVAETDIDLLDGYYTVNFLNEIEEGLSPDEVAYIYLGRPLSEVDNRVRDSFGLFKNEENEYCDVCATYTLDEAINNERNFTDSYGVVTEMLKDVFVITDYSTCKVESEAYGYMQFITIIFGIFFNLLIVVSVIFFNILLQVILSERISEIGIYRSVGSTSKDIKVLFFFEIIFILVLASIFSVILILSIDYFINQAFLSVIDVHSAVISFANINLSIGDAKKITDISFFNLLFYIVIVLLLIGYLSNRNVSKIANTKPVDILREVD